MIAPRERRPPALPPARGSAVFVSAAMAIAGSLMAAMMLLWVVLAVAVRRGQRLLAVAVRRGVCLERTWGGQTRGALARARGLGLRAGRLMAPGSPCAGTAEVLLDRNRRAIDAAACTPRARAAWTRDRVYGHQGCVQRYTAVRCGESNRKGRPCGKEVPPGGEGGLHYPPANRGRRSAAYPPPLS